MKSMLMRWFMILGALAVAAPAAAVQCNVHNLNGAYGVKFDGWSQELGRFDSVSIWVFDGNGALKAQETFNAEFSGPGTRTVEGTYELQQDCSFELFFPSELGHPHEAAGNCVLVDNGKGFYCIDSELGWVASATGTKIR